MNLSKSNIQPTGETILTETIALPQTNYRQYIRACSLSREIRDMANTHIYNEMDIGNKRPGFPALCRWYRSDEMLSYYSKWKNTIGSETVEQTLKVLNSEWSSFFDAIKSWRINKDLFKRKPNPPTNHVDNKKKWFTGLKLFPVFNKGRQMKRSKTDPQVISMMAILNVSVHSNIAYKHKLRGGRLKPIGNNQFVCELLYEVQIPELRTDYPSRVAAIDLGMRNFVTLGTNIGSQPFIIPGGPILSINHFYLKSEAKLKEVYAKTKPQSRRQLEKLRIKRDWQLSDYLHKSSTHIVDYCIFHKIDTIVIGWRTEIKQNMKLGKKTNQNFGFMGHRKLVNQVLYKAALVGIRVEVTEEAYTSKCSFLDNEFPQKHATYKGQRVKRGLFKTADGTFSCSCNWALDIFNSMGQLNWNWGIHINADLNGAYNIGRKKFPELFPHGQYYPLHPRKVKL